MDQKTVNKLEEKTEEAIAEIIVKMGLKKKRKSDQSRLKRKLLFVFCGTSE